MSYIDQKEMQLLDASSNTINPATDEAIVLLRRLLKTAEALSVVDSAQRLQVSVTNSLSIGSGTISTLQYWSPSTLDIRWDMIQWARTSFATGIRSQITVL